MPSVRDFHINWHGKEITDKVIHHLKGKVNDMGNYVKDEAIRSMKHDPKSGRYYYGRSGKVYQASAPGEAPAVDTGSLVRSMSVNTKTGKDSIVAYVGTMNESKHDTQYRKGVSLVLEMGLGKLRDCPRPFLRPALKKLEKDVKKFME